ncbi:PAS domain-containing protein [Haloferax sp. S1W]|uniref:PAS domain-containing protein n=1 Tax=Haloferax sp. S1W TaxID=3377110 RepID=UPI0037CB2E26
MEEVSLIERAFDELPTEVAILDAHGDIVYTNRAWRTFADANDYVGSNDSLGVNYLDVCDAVRDTDETARVVADGIRALIAGERDLLSVEYPCHSPTEYRWFLLRGIPFDTPRHGRFVLLIHLDITDRRLMELQVNEKNHHLAMLINYLSSELEEPLSEAIETAARLVAKDGADAASLSETLSHIDSIVEESRSVPETVVNIEFGPVEFRTTVEQSWADIETGDTSLRVVGDGILSADIHLFGLLCRSLLTHSNARNHGAPSASNILVGTTERGLYIDDDGPRLSATERDQLPVDSLLGVDYERLDIAIAYRIADLHGWHLELMDSELGGVRYQLEGVTWL